MNNTKSSWFIINSPQTSYLTINWLFGPTALPSSLIESSEPLCLQPVPDPS